jgi:hypothetical protein
VRLAYFVDREQFWWPCRLAVVAVPMHPDFCRTMQALAALPEVISDGSRRNIQSFGQFSATGIPVIFEDEFEKNALEFELARLLGELTSRPDSPKLIAEHANEGLKGASYGQSPALVALALKAGLAALQGDSLPQHISAPIPETDYQTMKAGVDYFPNLSDDLFVTTGFPQCNIVFDAGKLLTYPAKNE